MGSDIPLSASLSRENSMEEPEMEECMVRIVCVAVSRGKSSIWCVHYGVLAGPPVGEHSILGQGSGGYWRTYLGLDNRDGGEL
jgi:hypothetical protein